MKTLLSFIKYDYLQRTRTYAFLITLCISLAVAYSFVPEPNASYSTLRVGSHLGHYNSAWFGYVTAIMTSIFLSLVGFYLVNSGIRTDVTTRVGQILAATPVKNSTYLIAKTFSNFLVLLTIVILVFLMSILLFFLYHDAGFSFEIGHFIKPYLYIAVPSIFFFSTLAVLSEVIFGRFTILQNVIFFFFYTTLLVNSSPTDESDFVFDVFGSKIVTHQMAENVNKITENDEEKDLSIGYVYGNIKELKRYEFNGVDFPVLFLLSRLGWSLLSLVLVFGIAPIFHRFNFRRPIKLKKVKKHVVDKTTFGHISIANLPAPQIDYGIFSLLKTELLLLIRHGKKWMWIINIIGMILLGFLPLEMAHLMVLPIVWFLQVGRLSELTSKELTNGVHYFTFSSYKPLTRLLLSQILAASLLMTALALPLLIRYAINVDFMAVASIALGGIGIVLLAAVLGILSKGKKLFEILFFMISYANINGIAFLDYFGGVNRDSSYVTHLILVVFSLATLSILLRKLQLHK